MMRNFLIALIATLLLAQARAFTPSRTAFRVTSLAKSSAPKATFVLRMADEDKPSEGEEAAVEAPKISADGTFYDDEVS